jgi:steroid delta-isomerase-like uncharacterized protein
VDEPRLNGSEAPESERNKQRIRDFWGAAWNHGDLSAVDDLIAPNYVRHSIDPEPRDREYLKESILSLRAAFPDLESEIEDMVAEGDKVVTRWSAVGTQLGEFLGFPATGTRIVTEGVLIARFEDGRIVEEWATWNALDVLRDLGVIHIV